jgi:hypothetical protein
VNAGRQLIPNFLENGDCANLAGPDSLVSGKLPITPTFQAVRGITSGLPVIQE